MRRSLKLAARHCTHDSPVLSPRTLLMSRRPSDMPPKSWLWLLAQREVWAGGGQDIYARQRRAAVVFERLMAEAGY